MKRKNKTLRAPSPQPSPAKAGEGDGGNARTSIGEGVVFPFIGQVVSPKSIMLPYQRQFADDPARFKIGMFARQTGKDFSCSEQAVEDCYLVPKNKWTIAATGERQALESVDQAKLWAEAYKFTIEQVIEERDAPQALIKSAEIQFSNGSRLRAIPANPAGMRGLSTNVCLTEFAHAEKPDEIWKAMYSSITNPLRGGIKKLVIISTPNGRGNKFAKLWFANYGVKGALYSCHKVTIDDAVRMGLPVNIEELKKGMDDAEAWAQEEMCEFIDGTTILLPYELIAGCESMEATVNISPEYWQTSGPFQRFMGIDFGRKKNLTAAWTLEKVSTMGITKEVLALFNMSTPDQVAALRPRIQRCTRVALDYTGPGVGLGDYLVKEFGEYAPERHLFGKIELCTFSTTLLCDVFPKLRMAFEARDVRIPVDIECREDLHAIHRTVTESQRMTYKAPFVKGGHADRAYALALAWRALGSPGGIGKIVAFGRGGRPIGREDRELVA